MSDGLITLPTASPALPYGGLVVPSLVADQRERAAKHYIEVLAAKAPGLS